MIRKKGFEASTRRKQIMFPYTKEEAEWLEN